MEKVPTTPASLVSCVHYKLISIINESQTDSASLPTQPSHKYTQDGLYGTTTPKGLCSFLFNSAFCLSILFDEGMEDVDAKTVWKNRVKKSYSHLRGGFIM